MLKRKCSDLQSCGCSSIVEERGTGKEKIVDEGFYSQVDGDIKIDPKVEEFFTEMGKSNNFWGSLDEGPESFGLEPLSGEKYIEKYSREPIWELPLVGEKIFFLNKSHSKWICIGLLPFRDFEPTLKIVGVKKQCVCFNSKEWDWLMAETIHLRKYFDYHNGVFPSVKGMNMRLSPESFDGVSRILKIEKGGEYVYLSYEGLLELWRLKETVECRLAVLKDMEYNRFYNDMVQCVAANGGEIDLEIEKMYNGVVSESVCIMKELTMYWPQKIKNDVNDLRKNYI